MKRFAMLACASLFALTLTACQKEEAGESPAATAKATAKVAAKTVGFGLAGLLLLVLAAVIVILAKPGLVVNDRNLELAARYARKHEILDVTWKSGHVSVESLALSFIRGGRALCGLPGAICLTV